MSEVRVGYVSSIDYENGLCEIHYPDRDDTVTEMVPFLSNREYRTPEVEDLKISPTLKLKVLKRWKKPLKTARLCMRSSIRSLTEQKAPRWHGAMRRGLSCLHWRTDPITQSSMPRTL